MNIKLRKRPKRLEALYSKPWARWVKKKKDKWFRKRKLKIRKGEDEKS